MRKGQSLIEVFVALGVGVLMIGGITGAFSVILRSNDFAEKTRNATILNDGLAEMTRSFADGNWPGIYNLLNGSANRYHLINSSGIITPQNGSESITMGIFDYSRSFYVDNVSRDGSGNIEAVYNADNDDPSTQKITVETVYSIVGVSRTISTWFYVTRMRNIVIGQTDWSGGAGQAGPISELNNRFDSQVNVDFTTTPGSITPVPGACIADDDTSECELFSSIFDTGLSGGVGFNNFMWQGDQPSGTKIKFKIAASNDPVGPWNFSGPPLKPSGPDVQYSVDQETFNNQRYFKFKIMFDSASGGRPRIDDVSISLSR